MRSKRSLKQRPAGSRGVQAGTSGRAGARRRGHRAAPSKPLASITKQRLIEAALTSLRSHGFQGATARAIAAAGNVNQALIYYHFGSLDRLLLAAVGAMSQERLARYRSALDGITTLSGLAETMSRLYEEDVRIGHVTAVQELVAGSAAVPGLREEVIAQVEPWVQFADDVITRLLRGSFLEGLLPVHDVAFAICALYFGMEMLTHLNNDDRSRIEALFRAGSELAPLADAVLASARWSRERP